MAKEGSGRLVRSSRVKFWYPTVAVRKRGKIPHWHVPNGIYFVTFRLAASLPRHVEARIAALRARLVLARGQDRDGEDVRDIERRIFAVTDRELDQGRGACWLGRSEIAELISGSLVHGDGRRYDMFAFAVMPNHVHVVFRLTGVLDGVIKRWKSYTAHRANAVLERSGSFWQDDYFDVLIRDSEQLSRTVKYVVDNPANAGLTNWPYARVWPERLVEML